MGIFSLFKRKQPSRSATIVSYRSTRGYTAEVRKDNGGVLAVFDAKTRQAAERHALMWVKTRRYILI